MKKSYIKNVIALATVMLMSASVVSCDLFEKNDEPEVEPENPVVAYDFSGESKYEISILPPESDVISMIDIDSVGVTNSINSYNALTEEITTFQFDDNGLLRSMGSDSLVVAFSNYNGSFVDVAFVLGDEMYVIKEYDAGISWNEFLVPTIYNNASRNDIILTIDDYLLKLSELLQTYEVVVDGVIGYGGVTGAAITNATEDEIKKKVKEWMIDLGLDAMSPAINEYVDLVVEEIVWFAENSGKTGAGVTWSAVLLLFKNYDTWSEFCEFAWTTIFEWMDNSYNDSEDLAVGTLNSGYGDLKATLTWDFYADVDLHAVEPSGEHIYYNHKNSYSSDGFLDVDNRAGGSGSTENIYWENPAEGVYEIYIDHYGHSTYNGLTEEGMCKVSIMYKGRAKVYDLNLMEDETKSVGVMSLPDGTIIESRAGDGCIILEIKNLSNTQLK
ncbi:MAG: hypothetical protein IJC40_05165 [Muribaculaceae bacterium]|nr:hypothetical protein [Muribaculaceae bacterium]